MPIRTYHEIRDPIHVFVKLNTNERRVLNSQPVQRLRHIHQLAMEYMLYPGATHKRFEHSLGVMHLAGRVFDVITDPHNLDDSVNRHVPSNEAEYWYWRNVLRMAVLCHDIGHPPFSHATEGLLGKGKSHEDLTVEIIMGDLMKDVWESMRPSITPMDVAKVAVGPKEMPDTQFSSWETLLAEIISGDSFGVDRMDYLLRDSHHVGVEYGKFDHHRLIDTLRILRLSEQDAEATIEKGSPTLGIEDGSPTLGIEEGGIHIAEALLQARYSMFKQVYLHRVRVAYDAHLGDFLNAWLPGSGNDIGELDDNDVLHAIKLAARDESADGHIHARRIFRREHFLPVYGATLDDRKKHPDPLEAVYKACVKEYGKELVRKSEYTQKRPASAFLVRKRSGQVVSSHSESEILSNVPFVNAGFVLMRRTEADAAQKWIESKKASILNNTDTGGQNGTDAALGAGVQPGRSDGRGGELGG